MSTRQYVACILGLAGSASLLLALRVPQKLAPPHSPSRHHSSLLSLPVAFEANVGQTARNVQFVGRGRGLTALLTNDGIEILTPASAQPSPAALRPPGRSFNASPVQRELGRVKINFRSRGTADSDFRRESLAWKGEALLPGVSNYILGNDSRGWHTRVPRYGHVNAGRVLDGVSVSVYGNEEGIEYDLRIAPNAHAEELYLEISGADALCLDAQGDLNIEAPDSQIRMRKPLIYEQGGIQRQVDGGYVLYLDGKVGFHLGPHSPDAALVLDPSLSVAYSSFLGGAGDDSANSIALDSAGKLYIGGTTTSASTFPEPTSTRQGSGGGTDFFVAKLDPTASGPASLIYLTFVGGSGNETGGHMAVDSSGNAAIMGVTTSSNYPVTDGSQRTAGTNDLAVTEIDPTGTKLVYSTLFGGSGAESTQSAGGIAFGLLASVEYIYVVADTTSTDLLVTPSAFQSAFGGGTTDGFLTIFQPAATPHLFYCTYLGINAQVGVSSVAVDGGGNAFVAGFTSNPGTSFSALNGFQTVYGGDPFDAFLMEFHEYGQGSADLAYGTFLGGSASDQAFAVTVGVPMPATAYVTGTTSSTNFPLNATTVGPQTTLKGTANAFLAAIGQDATTGATSLLYSTYLGGSETDAGFAVAITASNSAYLGGKSSSWDFPWLDNLQPFNGDADAFVAKLDPTTAGAASLIYATPLGGTSSPGFSAASNANAIASNGLGNVYLAGETTAPNFPLAGNPGNGFQLTCTSCQSSPQAGDAFVAALAESAASAPSVSFNALNLNFGQQPVGSKNVPGIVAGVVNTGSAPLSVTSLGITGINAADFALASSEPCFTGQIAPNTTCSFEVTFSPSIVGPEQAFLVFDDNAPGNPQTLELLGTGSGPLAIMTPSSINFGNQLENTTSQPQPLTITNAGNQTLSITNVVLAGAAPTEFNLQASQCNNTPSLAPGASCQAILTFNPTAVGNFQAEVDATDNSGGSPGAVQRVPVTGIATPPAPAATIVPLALNFVSQAVGSTSGPQIINLSNAGSAPLNISSITLSGTNAASFGVAPSGTTPCPIGGGTIPIGAGCTAAVDFAPLASGPNSAVLNFNDNAAGSPQTVSLTGSGIAPAVQLSPANIDFGTQTVGVVSAPQTVTIKNVGSGPLGYNGSTIAGPNSGDFLRQDPCPPSLGVNASCTITVTMTPTAAGNRVASLSVTDNAPGSPQTVSLTGAAVQAGISISPNTGINFGSQPVSVASQPVPLTISDTGSGKLLISNISFTGANATDFSETDNCSAAIAAAGTCTIQVTFTPGCAAIPNARAAIMTFTDNAAVNQQSIPLAGVATGNVCIGSPPAGPSQTISPGQSATYPLSLISMAGFTGQATLTCTGAPAAASCSVPSTMNVSANASTPFQAVVTTTGSGGGAGTRRRPERTTPRSQAVLQLILLLSIACAAFTASAFGRRNGSRPVRVAQAAVLGAMLAAAVACGGGGGGSVSTDPTTPAGTSQITVSASAGGATNTLILTLTVN